MIIAIAMIFTIGLTSCEPKQPCEKNNTGDVKIYNNYSVRITVDVFSNGLGGDGFAGERSINVGGSTTYSNIPAGYIEIWEDDQYSDWGYWEEYLTQCEAFEFEISKKKSATIGFTNYRGLIDEKLKSGKK